MAELEQVHHLHHCHDDSVLLGANSDFVHLGLAASGRAMESFVVDTVQHRSHSLAATGEAFAPFSRPQHGAAKTGFLLDRFKNTFYFQSIAACRYHVYFPLASIV